MALHELVPGGLVPLACCLLHNINIETSFCMGWTAAWHSPQREAAGSALLCHAFLSRNEFLFVL